MKARDLHRFTRVTTLLTCVALALGLSACSGSAGQGAAPSTGADGGATSKQVAASKIAIFTPKDGFSISQHTPLNKWTKFTPRLTKQLVKSGFTRGNITTKSDGDATQMGKDVQDYVVNRLSSSTASQNRHTFLIVAPVMGADGDLRQYGDYVTTPADETTDAQGSDAQDPNAQQPADGQQSPNGRPADGQAAGGQQPADGQNPGDQANGEQQTTNGQASNGNGSESGNGGNGGKNAKTTADGKRLVKALKLARKAGAHVLVLADPIAGFTPDAYVQMSTPEQIGALQAQQLISKLALDKATSNHPKDIEVLLPVNPGSDDAKGGEEAAGSDTQFARQAFAGIWNALGPYFKEGKAVSPSGLIGKGTTKDDWRKLTFQAGKTSEIRDALDKRLTDGSEGSAPRHIDGIIAMNDFVSSGVVEELGNLKYTGTSADINPEISVSGIVGSITGHQDIDRLAVPSPKSKDDSQNGGDNGSTDAQAEAQSGKQPNKAAMAWPIVTGYGAYLDMIGHIVDGKQWMTGMENSQALCEDIAKVLTRMGAGRSFTDYAFVGRQQGAKGSSVPMISEGLVPVSADNLKAQLIEPGYISMADAGI
ncbi:hypothetical protein PT282_03700 [Bifidobacterium sp. ESL0763]|uniref:hypothetical protein n=1 Tax=Bifidobacterium sp. ESL0763 TaxID=2983227 RepID=UPI0023F64688|nr:hypothetical protein [Bifidobacterium sp. ESL0763]MDF7663770.1 hypothetical protein [Bifidobacterium sp. ESL0763]